MDYMSQLVLMVSTNALLIGALLILAGIYEAARWYLNVELGWFAWAVAIVLAAIVNIWILRHKPEVANRDKPE